MVPPFVLCTNHEKSRLLLFVNGAFSRAFQIKYALNLD
jgi:hypothetical protein